MVPEAFKVSPQPRLCICDICPSLGRGFIEAALGSHEGLWPQNHHILHLSCIVSVLHQPSLYFMSSSAL